MVSAQYVPLTNQSARIGIAKSSGRKKLKPIRPISPELLEKNLEIGMFNPLDDTSDSRNR